MTEAKKAKRVGYKPAPGTVVQAYRFALDPTPTQERELRSHAGAARVAYNWALAHVKANLDQRNAERTYDIADEDLTPSLSWTFFSLQKEWNAAKEGVAPWWAENSKDAYASGIQRLATALKNFSDSRKGARAGKPVGFPRFKSRRRSSDSIKFTAEPIRVEADRHHVTLPRLGTLHTHQSTRKLARRIEAGTARILSATVTRTAGRWFVAFSVEVQRAIPAQPSPSQTKAGAVGVDLGVKSLAALSQPVAGLTDEHGTVANPKHLDASLRRLRKASRAYARTQKGSKGRHEAATRLARIHAHVANQRRDGIHKLTTALATTFATVVIEDLNVAGMVKNRHLARAISDAGFGEVRRQLEYKVAWYGSTLIVADRWFPSSKTCSACGAVKAKLPLSDRLFTCDACGLVIDRDRNAAANLAALAAVQQVAGSGPETLNARGADCKTATVRPVAVKREPRVGLKGSCQTGTVASQGAAPAEAA